MTARTAIDGGRRSVVARCALGLALALGAAALAQPARASTVTVRFSGTVTLLTDTTTQAVLAGAGIVANTSTFTGSFTFDGATAPSAQGATSAFYPAGTLTVVVDGNHTFTSTNTTIGIRNDDPSFHDQLNVQTSNPQANNSFSILFDQNDSFLRFTLQDSTDAAFSGTGLPATLSLADFDARSDAIFIRSDLDRANGLAWSFGGTLASLQVTVPEPGATALLLPALAMLGARRWRP